MGKFFIELLYIVRGMSGRFTQVLSVQERNILYNLVEKQTQACFCFNGIRRIKRLLLYADDC